VADYDNDRVMRWCRGAKEGTTVVVGNKEGHNQISCTVSWVYLLIDNEIFMLLIEKIIEYKNFKLKKKN
jgi:dissimilatory sulfite reductase (desulfoviridin) alpha/beta subunit